MHQSRKHLTPIFHVGQVQSIQSGPPPELTIIFSGGTTGVPNISYLDSYSPQVGDYVHAIHTGKPDVPGGADWLVIGAVAAGPKPIFRGYVGSAYTLLTSGFQKLPLSVANIDTASGFSSANNWYVVPVAGYYRVSAQMTGSAVSPNQLFVVVYQNGSAALQGNAVQAGNSGDYGSVLSDVLTCAAGDTLALWAYSTSGGGLSIESWNNYLAVSPA